MAIINQQKNMEVKNTPGLYRETCKIRRINFFLLTRIFHESVMLSLKDLIHKGIFLGRAVLIDTVNQEKFLCGSKIKRERCRFMKYPG
jgi:hypothetical protein